jgi:hypothetical protein
VPADSTTPLERIRDVDVDGALWGRVA